MKRFAIVAAMLFSPVIVPAQQFSSVPGQGRSMVVTKFGIVLDAAVSGLAGRRAHPRTRRQRRRRRHRGQCGHGRRSALRQRHRRRPLRAVLRGQDRQALRPELQRMDAQSPHHRLPQGPRRHRDQPHRRRDHRRPRRRRGMGCHAHPLRHAALQPDCWRRPSTTPRMDFRSPNATPATGSPRAC